MKIIISHPTGNSNFRAISQSFFEENVLEYLFTSIACFPGNIWDKLRLDEFKKRSFNSQLQPFTKEFPWIELGRLVSSKAKLGFLTSHEKGIFSVDAVYKSFDNYLSNQLSNLITENTKAVYAYEDGALKTFYEAKKLGLKCIYDLPIAYWETKYKLLSEESIRLPDWSVTLGGGIKDSNEKLERKTAELELADIVVGPGSFVLDSIPKWANSKPKIISPFGSPVNKINIYKDERNIGPLRVLFVGGMGQRKGLGDLFEAINLLNTDNIELVVLGSMLTDFSFYKKHIRKFTYEPTRAHNDVLKLMRSCDVFCLPSIVEGRALVLQEAMSQGLPLIITPNTGGADLVEEGKTGFLVPIRDSYAIAEKINWFLENRHAIPEMSLNAMEKARNYTWDSYGRNIVNSLYKMFE